MTIILETYAVPEQGWLEIKVNRSVEIKVTAEEARRKVNRWLHNEVSYMMRALTPDLVVAERAVWRVPASLGVPDLGQVGIVGTIEVDVETGDMNNTSERKMRIEQQAERLASHLPPYQPGREVPEAFVAKDVPIAPIAVPPDDQKQEPALVK